MKFKILMPVNSSDEVKESLLSVSKYLKKNGHSVDDQVLSLKSEDYVKEKEADILKLHNKITDSLKKSDCIIADITGSSSGIGYLIAEALTLKKPVIALINKDLSKSKTPVPILGSKNRLLFTSSYNKENVESVIKKFVNDVKQKLDTKFILIISPEIERYLSWASDTRRMHKAQVVREAVENMMNKDKEYKDFLKSA